MEVLAKKKKKKKNVQFTERFSKKDSPHREDLERKDHFRERF